MKIAVTGGSGEFGSALVPYLLRSGHSVISIDRSMPAQSPPAPPSRPEGPPERLQYIVADILDLGQFAAAIGGADALVHLAAHRSPRNRPGVVVYGDNTIGSYNALAAAALLGIERVCLASSINAIGGAFSRSPRYDYFPVDEQHPTYAEDAYSLSKWVLEQQADAFARRNEWMHLASLRFHGLVHDLDGARAMNRNWGPMGTRHLWAYTLIEDACRATLLALEADWKGHEVFYIVAPRTTETTPSRELAERHYPDTPIRGALEGQQGFFDCSKAERLLGWRHKE